MYQNGDLKTPPKSNYYELYVEDFVFTTNTVIEEDTSEGFTGLFTHEGVPLYRQSNKRRIGFL